VLFLRAFSTYFETYQVINWKAMKVKATLKQRLLGLSILAVLFAWGFQAQAQLPYVMPTDTAVLPYNVSEMVQLIRDAYEAPVQTNAYVQMVEEDQDFPSLTLGEAFTDKKLKMVTKWVKTHPAQIESLLIARKKNHDIYFNPATTGSSNQ
jgi:hypothetical protein